MPEISKRWRPVLMAIGLLVLSGCPAAGLFDASSATGGIRGRVVDAGFVPVGGARVSLDALDGRSTISSSTGEFFLGNARDGHHAVYVYDYQTDSGAAIEVEVSGGEGFAGDIVLEDCAVVLTDPNSAGMDPSPFTPCSGEGAPNEIPPTVELDELETAWGEAHINEGGVDGFLEAANAPYGLDFYFEGNFTTTAGTTVTSEVADYNGTPTYAYTGLYDYETGAYYVLQSGTITLTVKSNADGNPSTSDFTYEGANLIFDFVDYDDGSVNTGITVTVGHVAGSGPAFNEPPPPPPTGFVP